MKAMAVPALAVFGKSKGGARSPADDETGESEPESEDEISEDFRAFASEAFPEMAGDDARLRALKLAIKECVEGY
jgi:hypothetical protein